MTIIKIKQKLLVGICLILVTVSLITMVINQAFIGRYYLYQQKIKLDEVANQLELLEVNQVIDQLKEFESIYHVTIAYTPLSTTIETMNEDLKYQFDQKKIKLNKFWLTEENLERLATKPVNKIYDQGKTKYQFLTKFIMKDGYIFAMGVSIPYINETVAIMVQFNGYSLAFSVILIGISVFIFAGRLIQPLERLKNLSHDISNLNFRTEEIHSNDEIEDLANSINEMSLKLKDAQDKLYDQNENLKFFISDVSHELKTPIAIIKSYAQGIEDGMDDGNYLETIINQADEMSELIERLLYLSKIERIEVKKQYFDLNHQVAILMSKYRLILEEANIIVELKGINEEETVIYADKEMIESVLNNLITNAIKYTSNQSIQISIVRINDNVQFKISNGVLFENELELQRIWNPFYTLEKSRSKSISGTGLGLAIVKVILENHKFDFGVELVEGWIEFYILFPSVTNL